MRRLLVGSLFSLLGCSGVDREGSDATGCDLAGTLDGAIAAEVTSDDCTSSNASRSQPGPVEFRFFIASPATLSRLTIDVTGLEEGLAQGVLLASVHIEQTERAGWSAFGCRMNVDAQELVDADLYTVFGRVDCPQWAQPELLLPSDPIALSLLEFSAPLLWID